MWPYKVFRIQNGLMPYYSIYSQAYLQLILEMHTEQQKTQKNHKTQTKTTLNLY